MYKGQRHALTKLRYVPWSLQGRTKYNRFMR